MRAFAKAPQIYTPSSTTTRSSLYETRSLCHWTSHRRGLTLSPQRVFTRLLHPPRPASLCGCEWSGLIWWKQWRQDGRDHQILASILLILPTCLFFPRPHFGRRHGRKRIQGRQPVSPGWVSGHATLPANGYWMEGKSRPPFQTCRMTSPLAVRAYSWPQRWFAELSRLLTAALWPILLRWDLSQANGMTWHPQPGLWALHLCLSMGAFRPSRECAKYYLSR